MNKNKTIKTHHCGSSLTPSRNSSRTPSSIVRSSKRLCTNAVKNTQQVANVYNTKTFYDRYIPSRNLNNFEVSNHLIYSNRQNENENESKSEESEFNLKRRVFFDECFTNTITSKTKVLNFRTANHLHSSKTQSEQKELRFQYLSHTFKAFCSKRQLPSRAEIVLDAPGLVNDFYLNLTDWSTSNNLAVGLTDEVYIWNHDKKITGKLFALSEIGYPNSYITSLKWMQNGRILAVGNSLGIIDIWDVEYSKPIDQISDHHSRISSLAWNEYMLSSGNKTGLIYNHDLRVSRRRMFEYLKHRQDICGLKWSPNGRYLCSGSDDCLVCVWDIASKSRHSVDDAIDPLYVFRSHRAAVKAIDWCPWQNNFLATGGGQKDKSIQIWNVYTGAQLKRVETNSQVTGLLWSTKTKEIVSSHGHPSNNVMIWKYPTMVKVGEFEGHTDRILSITMCPRGEIVASSSADQSIRFWEYFKTIKENSLTATPLSTHSLYRQLHNIR